MKEIIIKFFFGALCGAGVVVVVEMAIVASLSFIDFIKEFKEKWWKKMRVKITKASDYFDVRFAEFNTLEDLLKFQEECGEELIIARPWKRKNGEKVYDVIIYDDYVESDSCPIWPEGKKFIVNCDEDGNEDTEELIQCKDCEYYEMTESWFHHWCTHHEFAREPDDYCSDAERREKS